MGATIRGIFTRLGIADIASIITALLAVLAVTKRGRAWLIKPATDDTKELFLGQKRQELLFLIHAYPKNMEKIETVYTEYKALGGNSYIDGIVLSWRKQYEFSAEDSVTGQSQT